ncbi:MAG: alkaline phosphatase D family protein, partial [Planctomycetota bacterium]
NDGGSRVPLATIPAAAGGQVRHADISGLSADHAYRFQIIRKDETIASGSFRTAPAPGRNGITRIAFGSCFHKIGLHNPNLIQSILARRPHAMMLLGDLAVDDRRQNINMHRADYQLRDVSSAWCDLVRNVPVYASWDDHDYLDNDLSGLAKGTTPDDRRALRDVWRTNWNNPASPKSANGIYFSSRIGDVEIIMLDTRSCRDIKRRGRADCYLGARQLKWLKQTLADSKATLKIISSGTMWSDFISNGKDSWGTWDPETRESLFQWIEDNEIPGVALVSGDRHGARGFRIPRPSGFSFYEFEPASLGGVSGPPAMAENCPHQLFGYGRDALIAFGEFVVDNSNQQPKITFRLIGESGNVLQEHPIAYQSLCPANS